MRRSSPARTAGQNHRLSLRAFSTTIAATRLTPSHTNKRGQRYRYYVSQAILQNDWHATGSITRISAPDIEAVVVAAIRAQDGVDASVGDRDLLAAHVKNDRHRQRRTCEIELYDDATRPASSSSLQQESAVAEREWGHPADANTNACDRHTRMLIVPWTPRDVHRAKGVRDDGQPGLSDAARDQLLDRHR